MNRRRLFRYAVIAGACSTAADAAEPAVTVAVLRDVSILHGTNLTDDRLKVVRPVIEHAASGWRQLRAFDVPSATAPTQGILD